MTAPDIRERVRDLLTEHEVEASSWGWSCRCGVYGAGDNYVGHLVDDVLGAAGLLPTEERWRAVGGGITQAGWYPTRAGAMEAWHSVERRVTQMHPDSPPHQPSRFLREYTTGWKEVTE